MTTANSNGSDANNIVPRTTQTPNGMRIKFVSTDARGEVRRARIDARRRVNDACGPALLRRAERRSGAKLASIVFCSKFDINVDRLT